MTNYRYLSILPGNMSDVNLGKSVPFFDRNNSQKISCLRLMAELGFGAIFVLRFALINSQNPPLSFASILPRRIVNENLTVGTLAVSPYSMASQIWLELISSFHYLP